MLMPVCNI